MPFCTFTSFDIITSSSVDFVFVPSWTAVTVKSISSEGAVFLFPIMIFPDIVFPGRSSILMPFLSPLLSSISVCSALIAVVPFDE